MRPDAGSILISTYNYDLSPDLIAEVPLASRDSSRLLIYERGRIREDVFRKLPGHLPSDALLIANNSRVIEARILFQKSSGGVIEIFCLEPMGHSFEEVMDHKGPVTWRCFIGGASKWKPGQVLQKKIYIRGVEVDVQARYKSREEDAFAIEFGWSQPDISFSEVMHAAGSMPLPPYIKRKSSVEDEERYQTVFAQYPGSVAAPTAALHFTNALFEELTAKNIQQHFITLHVGAGTFKPVKSETIAGHSMHAENFGVSLETLAALKNKKEIVAVGTTSLRTLESLYWMGVKLSQGMPSPFMLDQWEAYELDTSLSYTECIDLIIKHLEEQHITKVFCETRLLIIPGYQFKSAKGLITNFHQPQSTLLLLVAAFIGEDWKKVYDYALSNNFRFLSYGDSSLLWRQDLATF
jgi:S-adenosylmethionine:tRNA ribosyltransferase-isomerase